MRKFIEQGRGERRQRSWRRRRVRARPRREEDSREGRGSIASPGICAMPDASPLQGADPVGRRARGPAVVPRAEYQVRLTVGGESQTRAFEVRERPAPRDHAEADYQARYDLLLEIRDKLTADARRDHADPGRARPDRRGGGPREATRATRGRSPTGEDLEEAHRRGGGALPDQTKSHQDPLNFPIRLNNKLALLGETVASADAGRRTRVSRCGRTFARASMRSSNGCAN